MALCSKRQYLGWVALALFVPAVAQAQSIAVAHCQGACPTHKSPTVARSGQTVIHHLYAAGINGQTSLPDWVAYSLTADSVGVASLLPRTWQPDPLIKFSPLEDIAQAADEELRLSKAIAEATSPYGGTPVQVEPEDRARLAPITGFANTPYWSELNNFSNMVPMPATLRLGPWLELEQRLNRLAAAGSELHIIAGPLYLNEILQLTPSSTDVVPAAYFKLVSDESGTVAFLFPNDAERFSDVCGFSNSLAEIQNMTDLEFFPGRRTRRTSDSLLQGLGCLERAAQVSAVSQ